MHSTQKLEFGTQLSGFPLKNDYEVLGPLFRNIKHSVKFNIELNHPNIKIENIPPKIVFVTFLKQVHNIDLEKDELDLILKNIKEFV